MDFWFDENEVFCAAVKECFFEARSFCKNIYFDKMNSLKTCATIVSREREKRLGGVGRGKRGFSGVPK